MNNTAEIEEIKTEQLDRSDLCCWDCEWCERDPWCTHPDQSLTLTPDDVDHRGLTASDCKGFTPIQD